MINIKFYSYFQHINKVLNIEVIGNSYNNCKFINALRWTKKRLFEFVYFSLVNIYLLMDNFTHIAKMDITKQSIEELNLKFY